MENKPSTTQTHIVLKISDCQKYLSPYELQELATIVSKVGFGRRANGNKVNEYAVCNTDEPYFNTVMRVILIGESKKGV